MTGLLWVDPSHPAAQRLRESGVVTSPRENRLRQREPSSALQWFPPTCTGKTPPCLFKLLPKCCGGVCLGIIDFEPGCPPLVACPRSTVSGAIICLFYQRRRTCDFEHNVVAPLYQSATSLPRPTVIDRGMPVGIIEKEHCQPRPNEEIHRVFLYYSEFHLLNQFTIMDLGKINNHISGIKL